MSCSVIMVDGPKTTIISLESNVWRQGRFNDFVFNDSNFKTYGPFTKDVFPSYKDVYACLKQGQDLYNCKLGNRYVTAAPWPFRPDFSYTTVKDPKKLKEVLKYDLKHNTEVKSAVNVRIPYEAIVDALDAPKISSEWEVGLFFDSM